MDVGVSKIFEGERFLFSLEKAGGILTPVELCSRSRPNASTDSQPIVSRVSTQSSRGGLVYAGAVSGGVRRPRDVTCLWMLTSRRLEPV